MSELTAKSLKSAAVFGPNLCRPLMKAISTYDAELSPFDLFISSGYFTLGPYYLDADKKDIKYCYTTLKQFRERLGKPLDKPIMHLNSRQAYFDPAIKFFKTQLEKKRDVVVNCLNEPIFRAQKPFVKLNFQAKINSQALSDYLSSMFDVQYNPKSKRLAEHFPFITEIRPKADTLVIIVPEEHSSEDISKDKLRLFTLVKKSKKTYKLYVAHENYPSNFYGLTSLIKKDPFYKEIATKVRDMINQKKSLLAITISIIHNQALLKRYIEIKKSKGMPEKLAEGTWATVVTAFVVIGATSFNMDYHWAVDNKAMRKRTEQIYSSPPAESLAKAIEMLTELNRLTIERSKKMAENILKKVKENKGKKIIIFPVGFAHALDIITELRKSQKISILGLMSDDFMDINEDILKSRQQ